MVKKRAVGAKKFKKTYIDTSQAPFPSLSPSPVLHTSSVSSGLAIEYKSKAPSSLAIATVMVMVVDVVVAA